MAHLCRFPSPDVEAQDKRVLGFSGALVLGCSGSGSQVRGFAGALEHPSNLSTARVYLMLA
jgi:hypothetical protein